MTATRSVICSVALTFLLAQPDLAWGIPDGKFAPDELAQHYATAVEELDRSVPANCESILDAAARVSERWASGLKALEYVPGSAVIPPSILEARQRLVAHEDLLQMVETLGELSLRISAARTWMELVLGDERFKLAEARDEVKARNLAEVQRAYCDYQAALAARQAAMNDLAALATGRGRVVARESLVSSSGGTVSIRERNATSQETLAYAAQLHAAATAPIYVAPPSRSKVADIHSINELVKRQKQKPALDRLQSLIDGELRRLAQVHTDVVVEALKGPNEAVRLRAVVSVGWWNGALARQAIDRAVHDGDASLRDAGITALRRLRLDATALKSLTDDESDAVRCEVARLASEQVLDAKGAMQLLRPLLCDTNAVVRVEAYAALNRLSQVAYRQDVDPVSFARPALHSRQAPIVVDAVKWLSGHGDRGDQRLMTLKRRLLVPLTANPVDEIRLAAQAALDPAPIFAHP